MRALRSCLLGGAVAAGGCSVFTSLDGFADPADAELGAPPAEAGPPTPDAGPEAGSFCQGRTAYLCVDFEDGAPLSSLFDDVELTNGATAEVVADEKPPASRALAIVLPVTTKSFEASCWTALPAELTRAAIELDVRVVEAGEGEPFDFVGLFKSGSREISVEIDEESTLKVDEDFPTADGGSGEKKTKLVARVGAEWAHVRWEILRGSSNATHTFFVNGVEVGETTTSNAVLEGASLVVGERTVAGVTKPWRVLLDNIVVELLPP